ncbi:hypothetical protein [Legionella spiritensis]|uniref:hypothetical protein n=1 Tax=Legionella spiritensis TaxID=452 RepID=UPI000F6DAAF0|nr:hypothetical protein [Legionella spiritensis]VEG92156.1 Uncharacterised protein [Legionella spiritensis]
MNVKVQKDGKSVNLTRMNDTIHITSDPEGDEISEQVKNDPEGDEMSEKFDQIHNPGPTGDELKEKEDQKHSDTPVL